jgi:hypothetical protein
MCGYGALSDRNAPRAHITPVGRGRVRLVHQQVGSL